MDHVVYVDAKAGEMEALVDGKKSMIIRGAAGRKMPYGRVEKNDVLYFINNNAEGAVRARADVLSVLNSDKMTKDESRALVDEHQEKLKLTTQQYERWSGKRYLVLVEVGNVREITPFAVDKSGYGNMDDWLPVGDINSVKVA